LIAVIMAELRRYRPRWPSFQAVGYVLHIGWVGKNGGGWWAIWLGASREFTMAM